MSGAVSQSRPSLADLLMGVQSPDGPIPLASMRMPSDLAGVPLASMFPVGQSLTMPSPDVNLMQPGSMPTTAQMAAQPVSRYVNPATGAFTPEGMQRARDVTDTAMAMGGVGPFRATTAAGLQIPVRAATESVPDAIQSNFLYGRNIGQKTVPIDSLQGGVALNDPAQAARVEGLKAQMTGPEGYISRPIVDTEGNVIEGQHRLEAMRQLGVQDVPVHVVKDLSAGIDTSGLHEALQGAQRLHGDHQTQLTQMLLEAAHDEGSPAAVREAYDPPTGFEKAWNAGLDYLDKQSAPPAEPPPSFTAYHGSPHAFDQFDLSKIGTGEGAQAYGYGHYLADAEPVAKGYRDALAGQASPAYQAAEKEFNAAHYAFDGSAAARARIDAAETALADARQANPGHMYEVQVNADPAYFLDWDKPLGEQHPNVQGFFKGVPGIDENSLGSEAYRLVSRGMEPEAAAALHRSGVPGIRYLDAGSRGAGEGSSNTVVFSPEIMNIIRRYGLAGLMAGGGAAAGLQQTGGDNTQ